MASFLNADLPSSDEEDDNYDPTKDKTGEKEDVSTRPTKRPRYGAAAGPHNACRRRIAALRSAPRAPPSLHQPPPIHPATPRYVPPLRRGAAGAGAAAGDSDGEHDPLAAAETRTQQVKKARAAELFEQLAAKAGGGGKAAAAAAGGAAAAGSGSKASGGSGGGGKGFDLAALCRPVAKQQQAKKKTGGDEVGVWSVDCIYMIGLECLDC
jgi:hypothetical protein